MGGVALGREGGMQLRTERGRRFLVAPLTG